MSIDAPMSHALSTWDGRCCRACGRWHAPGGICSGGTVVPEQIRQILTCGICGHMHTAGIPCVPGDRRALDYPIPWAEAKLAMASLARRKRIDQAVRDVVATYDQDIMQRLLECPAPAECFRCRERLARIRARYAQLEARYTRNQIMIGALVPTKAPTHP